MRDFGFPPSICSVDWASPFLTDRGIESILNTLSQSSIAPRESFDILALYKSDYYYYYYYVANAFRANIEGSTWSMCCLMTQFNLSNCNYLSVFFLSTMNAYSTSYLRSDVWIYYVLFIFRVCFIPKPVAVALYAVLDTCLVIDSGANNTVISPLVNLEVITGAVKCIPIGGTHLTRLLLDCIRTKGVDASVIVFKSLWQTHHHIHHHHRVSEHTHDKLAAEIGTIKSTPDFGTSCFAGCVWNAKKWCQFTPFKLTYKWANILHVKIYQYFDSFVTPPSEM